MDDEQLLYFKHLLHNRLRALAGHAGEAIGRLVDDRESHADDVDLATTQSDREFTLLIQERDRQLAIAIQRALARIKAGEFGICQDCGDEISHKRLMARPMAIYCIHCKTQAERLQYGGG